MNEQSQTVIELGKVPPTARLDQYLGLWCFEPTRWQQMIDYVSRMDMASHIAEGQELAVDVPVLLEGDVEASADPERGYMIASGGVALLSLSGALTKYGSSLAQGGSMIRARRSLALASRDPKVSSIVLRIDSPGGTVSGTADLANDVARVNERKPVVAFIEDLSASAAFWISSQAGLVLANETAEIGGIGVFMAITDSHALYSRLGIKTVVIKSSEFKGMGAPGTEITEAQQAELKRMVDDAHALFAGAVGRGRRLDAKQISALATGSVWRASRAKAMGLIDKVSTLSEAIEMARNEKTNRLMRAERKGIMSASSFTESVRAVLNGQPDQAHQDHREIATATIELVRAHDAPGHKAAAEKTAAEASGKLADTERQKAQAEGAKAERERTAEILKATSKLGLSAEVTAELISKGESIEATLKAAIEKAGASSQAAIKTAKDYSAPAPDGQAGQLDEALGKAAKAQAERLKA